MNPLVLARLVANLPYVSSVESATEQGVRLRLISFGWLESPIQLILAFREQSLLLTSLPLPTLENTTALRLAVEITGKLTLGKVVLREDSSLLYVARLWVRATTNLPRLLIFLLHEAVCAVSLVQQPSEK
ncbi:MAG: hypothetical protein HY360_14705 [Verrucomicrobia bacterium]|nr:hypothetical protein [Verrucomicrobiota bacterium]